MASPARSVLLPPVEIEVSPAQSSRSTYSASSSSYRRAHRDDGDSDGDDTRYDEKQQQQQQQQHQPHTLSSRNQGGASRTGRVHPDGGGGGDPYEGEMLSLPKRRENELRRSASNLSLQIKRHGCFGRLRRSPNFILFTVFLALFVDMATVSLHFVLL